MQDFKSGTAKNQALLDQEKSGTAKNQRQNLIKTS